MLYFTLFAIFFGLSTSLYPPRYIKLSPLDISGWIASSSITLSNPVNTLYGTVIIPPGPVCTSGECWVFWNGAQSTSPCESLMQPVLHYSSSGYYMDIWYIPYYPRNPSDPYGSTVTNGFTVSVGDMVTMGLQQVSSNSTHFYYQQWWSLTANSVPFTLVNGKWTSHTEIAEDTCDPSGEGGSCNNCAFSKIDLFWSFGQVINHLTDVSIDDCYQKCCADETCKAFNFVTSECYLLRTYNDSSSQPDKLWSVYVRGQLLQTSIHKNWIDPNGKTCNDPGEWSFGLVLEVFQGVSSKQNLPPLLSFKNVIVNNIVQNNWTQWISDAGQQWGMKLSVNDGGSTLQLLTQ